MTTPHPRADLLRAIADGKQMQDNEPAFPIRGGLHEHQFIGMSLRDYFAAKAMQGFLSSYQNGAVDCGFEYLADDAYDMADAMLKARAKGGVE